MTLNFISVLAHKLNYNEAWAFCYHLATCRSPALALMLSLLLWAGLLLVSVTLLLWPKRKKDKGVDVIIVGAGISGITMAKKLLDRGLERFIILEEGERVGGTWAWNTYPGCAVNAPALVYSFSWAYKPDWSRLFPLAAEIQVGKCL